MNEQIREKPLGLPKGRLEQFCRKHHLRKLSLFGSVLRDDFTPKNDVDVLVEFEPEHIPGLIRFCGMERELSEILGRHAELNTADSLSKYFRNQLLTEAQVQYESA